MQYYGLDDYATLYEVDSLIKQGDCFSSYFTDKIGDISSVDDYIDYILLKKLCAYKELIPCLKKDEDKITLEKFCNNNLCVLSKYTNDSVIRFINKNYSLIFDVFENYLGLISVTLDLISSFQNGIEVEVFDYILNNHPNYIIRRFEQFKNRIEATPSLIEKLLSKQIIDIIFESGHIENYLKIVAYEVRKGIFETQVAVDSIIEHGEKIFEQTNKVNVMFNEKRIKQINDFLISIKHIKANTFTEHVKQTEKVLNDYLLENGSHFEEEIDANQIVDLLKSDLPTHCKLLSTTHFLRNEQFSAILNQDLSDRKSIVDMVSTNIPTDSYFTFSAQVSLNIKYDIGAITAGIILDDKELFNEFIPCVFELLKNSFVKVEIDITEITNDYNILTQMLINLREAKEPLIIQSLCYGTAMFICSFIEKILRKMYITIAINDIFIPQNHTTLNYLLSVNNKHICDLLGETQVKHIQFLLLKNDNKVGHNYRNNLAHLDNISCAAFNKSFISKLFYVFISIVNSIFVYYKLQEEDQQV